MTHSMFKNIRIEHIFCFLICLLPPSLVAGAAVMEIVVFFICLIFFYLNIFNNVGTKYYKSKFFYLFIIFYLYIVFTSIISDYFFNSIRNSLFYIRFGVLTLAICYAFDTFKNLKAYFFYTLLFTITLLLIFSLLEIFFFNEMRNINPFYDNSRISGLFGSELIQGSYLVRLYPILIGIFFSTNIKFVTKKFFLFFLLVIFILIILSGERASIGLMFISFFLIFLLSRIGLKNKIFILLSAITLFLLIIFSFPNFKNRIITHTLNEFFDNGRIRIFSAGHEQHYKSSMHMFRENFLFGVGVRNFRMECQKEIYKLIGPSSCTTHSHNTYIQLLAETGIFGFFFIIGVFIYFARLILISINNIYFSYKKINFSLNCYAVCIFLNLFPLIPTGNFFNNWLSTMYFLPLCFFLHEKNKA